MASFTPNRSLLNPKFEGYKLDALNQEEVVDRHVLVHRPNLSQISGRGEPLSFHEMESRVRYNHLAVSPRRAAYVDADYQVVVVDIDLSDLRPSFRVVFDLRRPIQTSGWEGPRPEIPSIFFLTSEICFVADGHTFMFALQIPEEGRATVLSTFELTGPSSWNEPFSSLPFRVQHAAEIASSTVAIVLSSIHHSETQASSRDARTSSNSKRSVEFNVFAIRWDLSLTPVEGTQQMDIFWARRGSDVPTLTAFDSSRRAFILAGSAPYRELGVAPTPHYEPSSDEMAGIPRPDEINADGVPRPPPYSWTQTDDTVTVAFPLPSSTGKEDIQVTLSTEALTLSIQTDTFSSPVPLPRYSSKTLWESINPSSSYWTWDREAERAFGLLTLHLDKKHQGVKWGQVFAAAGTTASAFADSEDIEVPETLDPSELANIRETLEKFTAAASGEGSGLGKGVPSLAQDEMDEEVDFSIGRDTYLTWVAEDGSSPAWAVKSRDAPLTVLSTMFPGHNLDEISLIVKYSVDGCVFTLAPASGNELTPEWTHTSTYSALGFVLASKRDTRFTYHVDSRAVFAYESGSGLYGGNVYIYRGASVQEKWAKQAVLKVGSGGSSGTLLGAGTLRAYDGKLTLIALTEGELVVLHDIV